MNALSKAKRIRERRRYEDLLALNLDGAFPPTPHPTLVPGTAECGFVVLVALVYVLYY